MKSAHTLPPGVTSLSLACISVSSLSVRNTVTHNWKCQCTQNRRVFSYNTQLIVVHGVLFLLIRRMRFLFSDKTIKLWKISERDKRAEGYNLKDEDGRLRDPFRITALRVYIPFL